MVSTLRQHIAQQYSYARTAHLLSVLPSRKLGAERQRRKIVKPLYHVHSFKKIIEAHDSMNASLQRSCKDILRLLYHDSSNKNRIECRDSMVSTLRQHIAQQYSYVRQLTPLSVLPSQAQAWGRKATS